MKSFDDYLNEFKALKHFNKDKEIAEYFGFRSSWISNARKQGHMADEYCEQIAATIGADPIMVQLARDAVKGPEKKRQQIEAFMAKHVAALLIVAVTTGMLIVIGDQGMNGAGHIDFSGSFGVIAGTEGAFQGNKSYRKYLELAMLAYLALQLFPYVFSQWLRADDPADAKPLHATGF